MLTCCLNRSDCQLRNVITWNSTISSCEKGHLNFRHKKAKLRDGKDGHYGMRRQHTHLACHVSNILNLQTPSLQRHFDFKLAPFSITSAAEQKNFTSCDGGINMCRLSVGVCPTALSQHETAGIPSKLGQEWIIGVDPMSRLHGNIERPYEAL